MMNDDAIVDLAASLGLINTIGDHPSLEAKLIALVRASQLPGPIECPECHAVMPEGHSTLCRHSWIDIISTQSTLAAQTPRPFPKPEVFHFTTTPVVVDFETDAAQYRVEIVKALHKAGAPLCHQDRTLMSAVEQINWLADRAATHEELREVLALLYSEIPKCAHDERSGNAPGHGHSVPGIWDDDNIRGLAGKSCAWCAVWNKAKEMKASGKF
jgi:hypothetical protein